MPLFKCDSPVISSKGSDYYDYYNISDRFKVEKPRETWYKKDLLAQGASVSECSVMLIYGD